MNVHMLTVGPIGTNCYILDAGDGRCAVVDPGGDAERILAALDDLHAEISTVLLTHGHYDHTGAVAALTGRFPDAEVYLHRLDWDTDWPDLFPLRGQIPYVKHVAGGDTLDVCGESVSVLHTPGHTPGSVCYLWNSVLFSGDTLFAGSCGRTDFPGGSTAEIMESLRRLAELPGDYTVCPGHMELTTMDAERRSNPYLRSAVQGGNTL